MREKIFMSEHGLAVSLSSPCCNSPMNLSYRESKVIKEERKIETIMDFQCVNCESTYSIELNYNRVLHNVKIEFSIDLPEEDI